MDRALFLLGLLLFFGIPAKSQLVLGADSMMLKKFDFEDKQISEFFDRFNFKEPVKFAGNIASTRARNLIALLNLKDSALYHDHETAAFIKYVSNDTNKVYLDYGDKNWFAIVHCDFIYKEKNCRIDIVLKPEGSPQNGYKWVICHVKGDVFSKPPVGDTYTAFIDPMNHEVGFTELSNALLKHNTALVQYVEKNYHPDYLAAFLMLVKSGALRFSEINSVDYDFLQVSGWHFTVGSFNRKEYNAGWLISSIKKMSDEEKGNYIKLQLLSN